MRRSPPSAPRIGSATRVPVVWAARLRVFGALGRLRPDEMGTAFPQVVFFLPLPGRGLGCQAAGNPAGPVIYVSRGRRGRVALPVHPALRRKSLGDTRE